ncbi:M28 family peptidase [Janibacter sp. YIM B02568]|uniref:M28 family peptidase n=1 Tax=Janibacter endophyticus TaxID=2806261 RepID=UPI001951939E|nr:M28 family peptidase [Janibacter endophyticus]MBM6544729.1 M28 family peptidase [Janibacter endophyticus]
MKTRRTFAVTASTAALTLATATIASGPAVAQNINTPDKMTKGITADAVMDHLEAFQAIADANGGTRAAGTPGYEVSAKYVEKTLKKAGYTTERQYFPFFYEMVHETSLTEVSPDAGPVENTPMSYSQPTPEGGVTGELAAPATATGCDAGAYAGANLDGMIALVSRGTCTFGQKAAAAHAAGAEAVIVYNNAAGPLNGTLGGVMQDSAPATGVTQAVGQELLGKMANGPVTMTFILDKTMEERETFNVIAETRAGRDDNVVMVGAHLDGAPEGAGINDNASGSAGILETAVQLGKAKKLNNKVRFAWWGAEELGLIGSDYYVQDLVDNNKAELENIATYLNFDMIASPNHIIGVYDADESTYEAPVAVPKGSAETEDVFTDYFDGINQPWVDTEFSGRSDYSAFIANGVPASGLFTGADGTKTAEEVEMFGGTEGVTYDPNYHTAKDDIHNINVEALDIMSDAIGYATMSLALDTSAVNGKRSAGKSGKPHPQEDRVKGDKAAA